MTFRRLNQAFKEGCRIRTPGGVGITRRRRLADLILPTGELTLGFPGYNFVNVPSKVHPVVEPGRYSVFISAALPRAGHAMFAFLTVLFSDEPVVTWEAAGDFFTDSGTGCVFDRSLTDRLRERADGFQFEEWRQLKMGVYEDGDGSLRLDEVSGANAILFRTFDWGYNCFVGKGRSGRPACLVIDGRVPLRWGMFAFWQ